MKEKALVIESGDILDILSEYITMPMTFSINLEDPSTNKSKSGKKTKITAYQMVRITKNPKL